MSFRAGGVLGDQADYQTDEELRLVHWECDSEGCERKTQPLVNQDIARRYAAQEGWSISDEGAFCPKHRDDREIGPRFEIVEDPWPETPAPAPAPSLSRDANATLATVFLLIIIGLGFTLFMGYIRLRSAEARVTWSERDQFEGRARITRLSCEGLYAPVHCSGRMSTEGKPDVPVRYVCTTDDCEFEK